MRMALPHLELWSAGDGKSVKGESCTHVTAQRFRQWIIKAHLSHQHRHDTCISHTGEGTDMTSFVLLRK